ncbi:MAG: 4Fe-4S dicluster domain-containing protein [Armatimonadota bacterium]
MTQKLAREKLGEWLKQLSQDQALIAPTRDDKGRVAFAPVDDPKQIVIETGVVAEGPKRWFYPPSEEMFRYAGAGANVRVYEPAQPDEPWILFGLRPCDAIALEYSDKFWTCDEGDPYYARRRAAATIVAMNCDSVAPECFCESISKGLSNPRGMDILVTPLSAKEYLVETFTEKGEAALQATTDLLSPASDDDVAARVALAEKTAAQQKRSLDASAFPAAMQKVFKNNKFWQKHSAACIGCGVCTFMCPTCTCFDVMDDSVAGTGYRYRCWDTCQFRQFCEEASGHDRRATQWERQRQRIGHKLWYSVDRFGDLSCVGCGRCIKLCPVNIDICEVAKGAVAEAETEAAG